MNVVLNMRCKIADLRGRGVYSGWPNENRAIFVHIPKTAGTSVSKALGLICTRHVPFKDYILANPGKFSRFFKFAFVRNPYDRLLSSYAFLRAGGMNAADTRFAEIHVRPFESFEHFVTEGLARNSDIQKWVHLRPQSDFICDKQGRNMMDFTGRFEKLDKSYENIANILGKPKELTFTNPSNRGDYRDIYTQTSVDIVKRIYAGDLYNFGYKFN